MKSSNGMWGFFKIEQTEKAYDFSIAVTVAYGIVFPNGKSCLAWHVGDNQSIVIFNAMDELIRETIHKEKMRLVWLTTQDGTWTPLSLYAKELIDKARW